MATLQVQEYPCEFCGQDAAIEFRCPTCDELRVITDDGNNETETVEVCSCGDTEEFKIVYRGLATCKSPRHFQGRRHLIGNS